MSADILRFKLKTKVKLNEFLGDEIVSQKIISEKENGGPAFPISLHPDHGYGPVESINDGMSLRDYFAAKSDIPWSKACEHASERLANEGTYLANIPVIEVLRSRAILRFMEADAMLKERES